MKSEREKCSYYRYNQYVSFGASSQMCVFELVAIRISTLLYPFF